jgi:hypothetical protein
LTVRRTLQVVHRPGKRPLKAPLVKFRLLTQAGGGGPGVNAAQADSPSAPTAAPAVGGKGRDSGSSRPGTPQGSAAKAVALAPQLGESSRWLIPARGSVDLLVQVIWMESRQMQ